MDTNCLAFAQICTALALFLLFALLIAKYFRVRCANLEIFFFFATIDDSDTKFFAY